LEKARFGYRLGEGKIIDHMIHDGLLDAYENCVMGQYAEDAVAVYGFTRKELDDYAYQSFMKARKAIEDGSFKNETVPIKVKTKKTEITVDTDEIPGASDLSKMFTLKPAFRENGTLTAASSSSISDGAAAVMLMRQSKAEQLGLTPIAKVVAQSCFSQSPKLFATAPIGAIKSVLEKSNWNLSDVDLFEINEAFAVVPLAVCKEYSIALEKVNIFGGSCALGHPLGTSGVRIVVTLLNAMTKCNLKKGLATLCVGGGEGVAMSFEKIG
jgi:acetyl-CoA C-acetyltransferase